MARITKKEKKFFSQDIQRIGKQRGWPPGVVRKLINLIPKEKNYFDQILLSLESVFVFQGKKDVTDKTLPISVEVFSLQGRFLGYAEMKEKPIFISQERMYFIRTDSNDNLYLTVTDYQMR